MEIAQLELAVVTQDAERNVGQLEMAFGQLATKAELTREELRLVGETAKDFGKQATAAIPPVIKQAQQLPPVLKKTNVEARGLVEQFKSMKAAVAALGFYVVAREAMSMVAEFEKADAALAKLKGSLRATGQFSEEYVGALYEQAAALQQVTRSSDDQVMAVQQQLVTFGASRDSIEGLTRLTLDFAESMGMDAATAATLMGKAMQGQFEMFGRYGVKLSETMTDQQKLDEVLRQLQARSRGLAEEMGRSASGQLAQARNAWSDLKEEVGGLMLMLSSTALQDTVSAIRAVSGALAQMRGQLVEGGTDATKQSWFYQLLGQNAVSTMMATATAAKAVAAAIGEGKGIKDSLMAGSEAALDRLMGWDKQLAAAAKPIAMEPISQQVKKDPAAEAQALRDLADLQRQLTVLSKTSAATAAQMESDAQFKKMGEQLERLAESTDMSVEEFDAWAKVLWTAQGRADTLIDRMRQLEDLQSQLYALRQFGADPTSMATGAAGLSASAGVTRLPGLETMIQQQRANVGRTRTVEDFEHETAKLEMLTRERQRRLEYGLTSGSEAFAAGWRRAAESFGTSAERIASLGEGLSQTLDSNMTDAFTGMIMGTQSVQEAFSSMASAVVADLVRIMVQQLVVRQILGMIGAVGGMAGGGVGMTSGMAAGGTTVATFHRGGVVGSAPAGTATVPAAAFDSAPRFASGGVAADEVPIVAHRGEVIFNSRQFSALMQGRSDGGGGQKVEVVNVVDPRMVDDRLASNPQAMVNVISRNASTFRAALGLSGRKS